MDSFYLEGTDTTLTVELNKNKGIFLFQGKTRPENAIAYYEGVFKWLDKYQKNPNEKTNIHFKLEYFNSSSAKMFLKLMVRFEELYNNGHTVKISWFYKPLDEDILEAGEDFASLIDVPFEFYEL